MFWVILVALYVLSVVASFVWYCMDRRKYMKEYGGSSKLERRRTALLPRRLRKVDRQKAFDVVDAVCIMLSLPAIDEFRLRWRACSNGLGAGMYQVGLSDWVSISVNGVWRFRIDTLLHELAHHVEATNRGNFTHNEHFLASEELVFDKVEELIRVGVI